MSIENTSSENDSKNRLSFLKARLDDQLSSGMATDELVECLLNDQRFRFENAQDVETEDYFDLFPEIALLERYSIDLIYSEFLLRIQAGRTQSQTDFLVRFPRHSRALEKQFQVYDALKDSTQEGLAHETDNQDGSVVGNSCTSTVPAENDSDKKPDSIDMARYQQYLSDGRFRVDEVIGQGTFAVVLKAWDNTLRRWVAIKFARNSFDRNSVEYERFSREAESAACMAHPGVIRVFEFGGDDRHPYIVQEFAPGGTLKERIQTHQFTIGQAANWVAKIGDAIEYAHQVGIVHRDIKPENILFDDRNNPKVTDFGLAGLADQESQLTQHGDLLGTPAYMSPEQATGQTAGPPSDIYSLGVVLYELLYGTRPFVGPPRSVLQQVATKMPAPPRDVTSTVPKDLQIICIKAMSKNPAARYSSAQEMSQDLRRFLFGSPILARPIGPGEKAIRWCVCQPAFALTILSALLALFVLGAVSLVRINFERNRFRQQRDIANASLFQSLIKSAETRLSAKQGDWYDQTLDDIKNAASLEVTGKNRKPLQDLVLETLSDTSIRILPGKTMLAIDQPITAIDSVGRLTAIGYADGRVRIVGSNLDENSIQLAGPDQAIEKIKLDAATQSVYALSGSEFWKWDLATIWPSSNDPGFELPETHVQVAGAIVCQNVTEFALTGNSSNGTCRVAIATTESTIQVFDYDGNTLAPCLRTQAIKFGRTNQPTCMQISDSGKLLATGFDDRSIKTWRIPSGLQVDDLKTAIDPPVSISIASDDEGISWTTRVSYTVESMHSSQFLRSALLPGAVVQVDKVNWPDGEFLICGTDDGSIVISDRGHTEIARVKLGSGLNCFAVNQQELAVFAGDDSGNISRFKIAQSTIAIPFQSVHGLTFSQDSELLFDSSRMKLNSPRQIESLDQVPINCMDSGKSVLILAGTSTGDIHLRRSMNHETEHIYRANETPIHSIQLGDSEKWFAITGGEGTVQVWSTETLKRLQTIPFGLGKIFQITCHPEHDFIFAVGERGAARCKISGRQSNQSSLTPFFQEQILQSSIDVTQETVCIGADSGLHFFDVDVLDQSRNSIELTSPINHVEFSKDGKSVFAITGNSIGRWESVFGKNLFEQKHDAGFDVLTVDPEGEFIVVSSAENHETQLRDFTNGHLLANFPPATDATAVLFSGDGEYFWMGFKGAIRYQRDSLNNAIQSPGNFAAPEIRRSFDFEIPGGSWNAVWSTAASQNNRWIASGRHDRNVSIRNAVTGRIERTLSGYQNEIWCCEFSSNSELLATGTEVNNCGEVVIWNTGDWSVRTRLQLSKRLIAGLSFHPTASWLAVSSFDGSVCVVDYHTGNIIDQLLPTLPRSKRLSSASMDVEFSPDGRWLAAARKSNGISIWKIQLTERNLTSKTKDNRTKSIFSESISLHPASQRIWAIAFDHETNRLAAASETGQVDLFRVGDFHHLASIRSGRTRLRAIEFSPNGRYLATSAWASPGIVWNLALLEDKLHELGLGFESTESSSPSTSYE